MAINYHIREVVNPDGTKKLFGQVVTKSTIGTKELISFMRNQGSTVSISDMLAVIEDLASISYASVMMGHRVHIEKLCDLYPTMQGTFKNYEEHFDKSRHKLIVKAKAPAALQFQMKKEGTVKRVSPRAIEPIIESFIDIQTLAESTQVTQGQLCKISGQRLKIHKGNNDEGIYFVNRRNSEQMFKVDKLISHSQKEIVFVAPAIDSGILEVNLVFISRGRKNAKQLKKGIYETKLAVV